METCFNYLDKEVAFFSSDERKWITKIRKLKKQYPEQVTIIRQPEVNDGCIYCKLPPDWLRIQPKVVKEMTEEEKQVARERFMKNVLNREI